MGGKVNRAASKHLRGPEEDRDYRTADSPGWRRRAGKATQVTAAFRPVTQVMVTNGSHRGSKGSGVAGETEAPDSPVPPLCASRDAPEPVLTGSFPARGVTAAVTVATAAPRSPHHPPRAAASHRSRPGCDRRRCSGSVHPPARLPLDLPEAAPRPPPAASPLPPAPPPPSTAAAAATAAGGVTSAPAGPALPHCAAAGGGRSAPKGEGEEPFPPTRGRSPGSGACEPLGFRSSRDLSPWRLGQRRSGRVVRPGKAAEDPASSLGVLRARRSSPRTAGRGYGRAAGARAGHRITPCRLRGPDRPGRAVHGLPAARAGWRPESCPWCQTRETAEDSWEWLPGASGCGRERESQQPAQGC